MMEPTHTTGTTPLDLVQVAEQLVSQPELFGSDGSPIDHSLVEGARTVAAGRFSRFSGKTTCKNEARALSIAVLRLSGVPKREIARRMHCHRHVIDAVMDTLEASGKIDPIKERLPRLLGRVAEDAAERALELIHSGECDTDTASMLKSLGVLAGIGSDKVLGGQAAGDLHLHQHQHVHVGSDGQAADPLRDYLRQRSSTLRAESESGGGTRSPLGDNGLVLDAAPAAASDPPPAPAPDAPPAGTDDPHDHQVVEPSGGRGGGARRAGGETHTDGTPSETFEPNGPHPDGLT